MADKCDNDMFTGKAGKGKRKLRGPYNQYLSQPEANIPRSTLQKWPKTTSVNNTLPAKSSFIFLFIYLTLPNYNLVHELERKLLGRETTTA